MRISKDENDDEDGVMTDEDMRSAMEDANADITWDELKAMLEDHEALVEMIKTIKEGDDENN